MTQTIDDIELRLLLEAIYHTYHYDFRGYAQASIKRRMVKAREDFKCESYSQLQDQILRDSSKFHDLLSYLTVQVTEMFRNPSYYQAIRQDVVPILKTYPSLKVWVAGCSSGEELYSLMILFKEEGLFDKTIFYGTDINTDALKTAEEGIYRADRMPLYTENYKKAGGTGELSDYYTSAYDKAVFDKTLKKQAVFSDHSLVTDNVFAEVQLVSCRNVLIYFNRELQDRAFKLFSDSLQHNGFLGLGAKETIRFSSQAENFADFNRSERLYQKKA